MTPMLSPALSKRHAHPLQVVKETDMLWKLVSKVTVQYQVRSVPVEF